MSPELMQTIITAVVGTVVTAVMGILTAYVIPWLKSKIALIKKRKSSQSIRNATKF